MSETGSDTRSGIGARLRAGRERMGLTLLQAAEKIHVDPKVVEALEAERFDALGAPVFVRGHLKRYSEMIGEQAGELIELYTGATKPVLPDLTQLPKAAPQSAPGRLAVPALLVLIGFVLIGIVWWVMQSVRSAAQQTQAPAAREVPLEPQISTPSEGVEGASAQPTGNATSVNAGDRPGGQQGNGQAVAAGGETQVSTSSAAGPAGPEASEPVRDKPIEVTLRFAADSWVEIYDANGEKLFYDIGSADSRRTVSGIPPLRVTLGNAPGVTLDVSGMPATVPANAVRDDTAHFTISRSGRIVRARAQAP